MTANNKTWALTAKWVVPVEKDPVKNGVVVVEDGVIKAVLRREEYSGLHNEIIDYGNAVICPGLINLHTHLDYSDLAFFDTQAGLFQWIGGLVSRAWKWSDSQWKKSALNGAMAILNSGTTCIADSSFTGNAAWAASLVGLRAVVGLELFGINEDECQRNWQSWLDKHAAFMTNTSVTLKKAIEDKRIVITIAPHTPYTVCPSLWQKAKEWADARNLPMLVHIAESKAECAWIAASNEEVDQFLLDISPEKPKDLSWKGEGLSPVAHLDKYGLLGANTLAAHAVHLSDEDLAIFKRHGVAIAHCPRSNSRLRNGIAPLDKFISEKLSFGFGTDSLASNDDLSLLNDARFAWNTQKALSPTFAHESAKAVFALTLGAASAIKQSDKIGSLVAGKCADIAVFALPANCSSEANPYDLLLYGSSGVKDVFVEGKRLDLSGKSLAESPEIIASA